MKSRKEREQALPAKARLVSESAHVTSSALKSRCDFLGSHFHHSRLKALALDVDLSCLPRKFRIYVVIVWSSGIFIFTGKKDSCEPIRGFVFL